MGNIIKGYKIDIPNVTGNIAITVRASDKSGSGTPINGDVMGYLTYGKGINQTTAEIRDDSECWASVNLVPVTQGKTYTISCDATYAWVYSFDANGNYVSTLTTGDNKKPQNITFVADSPYIRFGCYDPNHTLTYCRITETSSSGGTDEPTEPSTPVNGDIMNYLTYGKGINQTTAEIKDETGCWATVNSIEVEKGATYTLKMDATWAWVYSYDESGNFSSDLVLGNDVNPQEFTFTADTTKIKVGCYDPNNKLTYCTVTKVGATIPEDNIYSITNNLTNCINSNTATSAYENSSYIATITENNGYELDNVNVVMGGTDITSTVVSDITTGNPPETSEVYSISYDLSNCTSDNTASAVIFGNSYSTTIKMNSGYELMNISITMGGTNVTGSVYTYKDGNAVINISNVTGNVVIVAQATASS